MASIETSKTPIPPCHECHRVINPDENYHTGCNCDSMGPEYAICKDCADTCPNDKCGRLGCNICIINCMVCMKERCENCLKQCQNCFDALCSDCSENGGNCRQCNEWFCENCLDGGLCENCRSK